MWTKLSSNTLFSSLLFVLILGILSGIFSTLFLNTLYMVTNLRNHNQTLIFVFPFFAILQLYLTKKCSGVDKGFSKILKNFSSTKKDKISLLLTPYILITSLGTHMFGGSAGREGVGVLMGTSISHGINFIKIDRKAVFYCGITSGFSAIFGSPLAAIIFPLEICKYKEIKNYKIISLMVLTSFISYYTTTILHLKHNYKVIDVSFSSKHVFIVIVSGLLCFIGSRLFISLQKIISKQSHSYIRVFIISSIFTLIVYIFALYQHIGIGINFIEETFLYRRSFSDFFIKMLLTATTLGIGMKGGEVTPLFYMGSSLINSTTSLFYSGLTAISSGVGMFTFFAAATLTPFTSTVMAYEYYGMDIALLVLPSSLLACILMQKRSIYE